jgi:hypothetical protein
VKLAFFRPLSSFTHWLDFQMFSSSAAPMHLVSIAWLVVATWGAWLAYRRLLGPTSVAGLAALFYALDPGHAIAAGWIAGRNGVLAACFGMFAIAAHDRWRRAQWRHGALIAPLAFAASLACGEAGLGTFAFVCAHVVTLDGPTARRRVDALAPHLLVVAAWAVAYRALGYGTAHSTLYLDPLRDPLSYARNALVSAPINLGAELGGPPSAFAATVAARLQPAFAIVSFAFVLATALAGWTLLRRDPVARFFALGAVLALAPIAATLPNDRNLFFVGFDAIGLAAQLVTRAFTTSSIALRAHASLLIAAHVVFALPGFVAEGVALRSLARLSRDPLQRVLLDDGVRAQTVVFVNPPAPIFVAHFAAMRVGTSLPRPLRTRALFDGIYDARLRRSEDDTLDVHVDGGILPKPGTWPETPGAAPAYRLEYMAQHLTSFVRGGDEPMRAGDVVELTGLRIEVRAVTDEGSPTDVRFRFDRSLDDPSLRWLVYRDGEYRPFVPPKLGSEVVLPRTDLTREL